MFLKDAGQALKPLLDVWNPWRFKMGNNYHIEYIYRPWQALGKAASDLLVYEIREVTKTCYPTIPDYQILRGTREELSDKVVAVARTSDKKMVGFMSAVLLDVPGIGNVVHLGLVCVRPEHRGNGLTHLLTSKVVTSTMLRESPLSGMWITNLSCVLGSLGNVALHFDRVYPSPFLSTSPESAHFEIAEAIDKKYRDKIGINPEAKFDLLSFVFEKSAKGTMFQKRLDETRYHHRERALNTYYQGIMDFENGDEVLQIAHVNVVTGLIYQLRRRSMRLATSRHEMMPVRELA